jgi:hypothetical protein
MAELEDEGYKPTFEILTPGKVGWHREKILPNGIGGAGLSDLLLYRPTGLEEPDSLLGAAVLWPMTVVAAPLKIPFCVRFEFRFRPRVCWTGTFTHSPLWVRTQSDELRITIPRPQ